MPKYPARFFSFYLIIIGITFFLPSAVLSAKEELTSLQEQARAYRAQGYEAQQNGKIEEALNYYQKAVLLDPEYAVAYNDAGVILEALGSLEAAQEMYLAAQEAQPDYPDTYSNLALLYEGQQDYANAVLCWVKRATLGGPDDPWAEAARRRLEDIAKIAPQAYGGIGGRYEQKSVTLFAQDQDKTAAVAKTDNKIRARDYLAKAKQSFGRGDYVTALKEATLAEYLDSSNSEISAFVEKVRKALLR